MRTRMGCVTRAGKLHGRAFPGSRVDLEPAPKASCPFFHRRQPEVLRPKLGSGRVEAHPVVLNLEQQLSVVGVEADDHAIGDCVPEGVMKRLLRNPQDLSVALRIAGDLGVGLEYAGAGAALGEGVEVLAECAAEPGVP